MQDDDLELFRRAVGGVRPLAQDRVDLHRRSPRVTARRDPPDTGPSAPDSPRPALPAVGAQDPDDPESFARPGVRRSTLRALRRGHYRIERRLDLHGMTVAVARTALASFLAASTAAGARCVCVIHGKGHGSRDRRPVLKPQTALWLRERSEVLAYVPARPIDGGGGALYVLLK